MLLVPAAQFVMGACASRCSTLVDSLDLEDTTVWFSSHIAAGTNLTFPGNHPTCNRASQVVDVDICRVSMLTTTGPTSNTSIEVWLPANWTGRFLSTGNGGTGGCIQYEDVNYAVSQGFAAVGTNNGHNGTIGEPFLNNPGVIKDFAYRALHLGVVLGKQVTKAFYGKEHTKSYYLGCSTGGRQGFKEAQDFPEDFDGIVAGAPAFAFTNLTSWSGSFFTKTGPPGSPTFLTTEQWNAVWQNMLVQCDGLDGQVDGILEDPDLCQYRPEALICGANTTGPCLTGTQAQTVRAVFSDLHGPDGSLNPFNIATWEGDLSGARARGARILHYHGLQDPIISSDNSARYYNHVARTMGLTSAALDEFYRYFRISGLNHCAGGPGATFIGNRAVAVAGHEPERNVLSAIVRWVEEGVAPDHILGTAYVNGTKTAGVNFERKHCKYPARNVYQSGDPKLADSWACV
ncbi:Pyrimidine pathway regulatory protein 1 [Verticillium dahliae VDG2]|nr:Pyrimidine pathway regulatory protein 1 [Verticillium dahliae VDG2]